MAKYNSAQYGRISVIKGKLNVSPESIRYDSLLQRERYSVFDTAVQDYDPLLSLLSAEFFRDVPCVEVLVSSKQEGRPDLVAYDYLGDPDYYPFIMQLNGLIEETDFVVGRKIRIPVKAELDRMLLAIRMQQER